MLKKSVSKFRRGLRWWSFTRGHSNWLVLLNHSCLPFELAVSLTVIPSRINSMGKALVPVQYCYCWRIPTNSSIGSSLGVVVGPCGAHPPTMQVKSWSPCRGLRKVGFRPIIHLLSFWLECSQLARRSFPTVVRAVLSPMCNSWSCNRLGWCPSDSQRHQGCGCFSSNTARTWVSCPFRRISSTNCQ